MRCARDFSALRLRVRRGRCRAVTGFSDIAGAPEESLSPAPTLEGRSEELPRAELQKEVEGCHLVPSGAGCPKIHSRRFRE